MLASMLLENASGGYLTESEAARYTAEEGAMIIAQETAQEMYEIFENEFMALEEYDLEAAKYTLEGTMTDAVQEGIADKIKSGASAAIKKIKELWEKLKTKVKEWIHNVKRFLDGIFMTGADFAKKYEKELKALGKNLTGYEYPMYNYSIENVGKSTVKAIKSVLSAADDKMKKALTNVENRPEESSGNQVASFNVSSLDLAAKSIVKGMKENLKLEDADFEETDMTKITKSAWSMCRDGASDETDKVSRKVEIGAVIKVLKESNSQMAIYNEMATAIESGYNAVISTLGKYEKNSDVKGKTLTRVKKITSTVTKSQTICNSYMGAVKTAMTERVKAYKSVCTGAFAYARKNSKSGN